MKLFSHFMPFLDAIVDPDGSYHRVIDELENGGLPLPALIGIAAGIILLVAAAVVAVVLISKNKEKKNVGKD